MRSSTSHGTSLASYRLRQASPRRHTVYARFGCKEPLPACAFSAPRRSFVLVLFGAHSLLPEPQLRLVWYLLVFSLIPATAPRPPSRHRCLTPSRSLPAPTGAP